MNGTVFEGGHAQIHSSLNSGVNYIVSDVVAQNADSDFGGGGSATFYVSGGLIIRNVRNAFRLFNNNIVAIQPGHPGIVNIMNTTGPAFWMDTQTAGSDTTLVLDQVSITNCPGAISIQGDHATVMITNSNISNNTGIAIDMAGTKLSALNNVVIDAATTMSGNSGGDFQIDTGNIVSVATLRAAPNTTILEVTHRLNRIAQF